MPNPVVHFEILGQDAERSQKFYSDLFGWQIDANNPINYGLVDTQAEGINGGVGPSDGGPGRVTIYVQVDDLQAYLDKAEGLGAKTVVPPTEIPGMVTFATFSDVDGNVVGLVKED